MLLKRFGKCRMSGWLDRDWVVRVAAVEERASLELTLNRLHLLLCHVWTGLFPFTPPPVKLHRNCSNGGSKNRDEFIYLGVN